MTEREERRNVRRLTPPHPERSEGSTPPEASPGVGPSSFYSLGMRWLASPYPRSVVPPFTPTQVPAIASTYPDPCAIRSYSTLSVSGAPARKRHFRSPRERHSTSITATWPCDTRPRKSASRPQLRWHDGYWPSG